MGLDNGFIVKSKDHKLKRKELPSVINYPYEEDTHKGEIHIIYWRKNWGLREEVLRIISHNEKEKYKYKIKDVNEIRKIIDVIAHYLDPEVWEDYGRSIWTFDEARMSLTYDIINLSAIATYMEQHPDVYLVFYDSY